MNHDSTNRSRDDHAFTRRDLIKHGVLLASASVALPAFLGRSASAMAAAMAGVSSVAGVPDERILVVVQFSGGNDGLNTVVPLGMSEYYRVRSGIAIPEKDVLRLSGADEVGLHPQMGALGELYDEGQLAIVQGVGYPNPNRSHFKSMDIWHTADTSATGNGWLGRYFDSECCGFGKGEGGKGELGEKGKDGPDKPAGPPAIAIGRSAPLAMEGQVVRPVSFEQPELFQWSAGAIDKDMGAAYDALTRRAPGEGDADTNADFLLRTSLDAQVSSDLIRRAVAVRPATPFPATELGRQLAMVSSMIRAGLRTRVYYVSLGGFDTHSDQGGPQGRHANLLKSYADAMKAFYAELRAQRNDARVLTMTFSEFGRRVGQNASQGTDHGTAGPMFLAGPMVRPGVLTEHPSLRDLDEGDLRFGTDFRAVYAGVLEQWLKADSKKVLEATFRPLNIIRA
jgi:uncharacterized protein (DUF1501 family)